MSATAEQIRNRNRFVTVPGTNLQVECRPPDPVDLIAHNLLPLETYAGVLETILKWRQRGGDLINPSEIVGEVAKDPRVWGSFIDRWVAAAAVDPQITLDEEQANANPAMLWIDDLDLDTKLEIFRLTNRGLRSPRLAAAVRDFRDVRPEGAGAGPGGAPLRDAPVGAAADAGPAAGPGV